jgi:ribosomal protein S18 acetylase RimI-like enzyme
MFKCNVIQETVTSSNIKIWEKKLKLLNLNNLQKKILKRYQVNSIDEYILLIKSNIDNIEKLKEIDKIYNKNKNKDLEEEKEQEKQRIHKLLTSSIKRKNSNVKIRMLIEKDQEKAANLYMKFKKIMDEDMEEAENYVEDFILKNVIFGIFENKTMAGIIILDYSRDFEIDDYQEKVKTFYIQELIVDEKFAGKGYGNLLINYAILRCPKDMDYISFMTMPSNIPMKKIASRFNFKLQSKPSGDKKHSLLFIRINDRIERELNTNLSYLKSNSS